MENKSEAACTTVLNALKQGWKDANVTPQFKFLITDYEFALMNSVKQVFGKNKVNIWQK